MKKKIHKYIFIKPQIPKAVKFIHQSNNYLHASVFLNEKHSLIRIEFPLLQLNWF